MTLLLREQVYWRDPKYLFDLQKYNFILNQKTAFTIDDQLSLDADHLENVLEKFQELDSSIYDLLQYYHEDKSDLTQESL